MYFRPRGSCYSYTWSPGDEAVCFFFPRLALISSFEALFEIDLLAPRVSKDPMFKASGPNTNKGMV